MISIDVTATSQHGFHKMGLHQHAIPVSAALLQTPDAALQLHHLEEAAIEVPAQLCLLDDLIQHCKSPCTQNVIVVQKVPCLAL